MMDKASAGAVRENPRTIGRYGEDAACAYLEENGYRIVGRNVYADGCEADILAENETHFVFAEVKTRREHPEVLETRSPRLDVIEVYLSPGAEASEDSVPVLAVRHFPDAVREKPNYARARKKY